MAKGYKLPHQARKESAGSITVEPLTKAAPHSEELVPPAKSGFDSGESRISPEPKAGMGWKAESAIGHPGDVLSRPDLDKT